LGVFTEWSVVGKKVGLVCWVGSRRGGSGGGILGEGNTPKLPPTKTRVKQLNFDPGPGRGGTHGGTHKPEGAGKKKQKT